MPENKNFRLLFIQGLLLLFFCLFATSVHVSAAFSGETTVSADLTLTTGSLSLSSQNAAAESIVFSTSNTTAVSNLTFTNTGTLDGTMYYRISSNTADWEQYITCQLYGEELTASLSTFLTSSGNTLSLDPTVPRTLPVQFARKSGQTLPTSTPIKLTLTIGVVQSNLNTPRAGGFCDELSYVYTFTSQASKPATPIVFEDGIAYDQLYYTILDNSPVIVQNGTLYISAEKLGGSGADIRNYYFSSPSVTIMDTALSPWSAPRSLYQWKS
ncbi:MAG: hypothetical protein ACK5MN_11710 [Lachnospiraceae bacterium]